jgi:GDP-L-fucose synthase
MKILITGSNGFLAKNISFYLKNYNVLQLSRAELDLTNQKLVKSFFENNHFDVVINTAVVGGKRLVQDSEKVFYDNIIMMMNLLQNKSSYKKLINFGSGAELDRNQNIHNHIKSHNDCFPTDYYGLSKNIIARFSDFEDNIYNLRIFNVFAHNEEKNRMIASNVLKYINNQSITIHQDRYMDFIYMNDFLKILEFYIISNDVPKTFNCVYSKKYKLSDIAKNINDLSNYKVGVEVSNKTLGLSYCGNYEDIGLKFDGLEKGIENIYEHFVKEMNEKFIN